VNAVKKLNQLNRLDVEPGLFRTSRATPAVSDSPSSSSPPGNDHGP
jgi:hypothetical protein